MELTSTKDTCTGNGLDMDKILALRKMIDKKLKDEGVYAQLRSLIQTQFSSQETAQNEEHENEEKQEMKQARMIDQVLESDVVQQLITSIKRRDLTKEDCSNVQQSMAENMIVEVSERECIMQLRLLGGKAFVDQMMEDCQNRNFDQGYEEQQVLAFLRVDLAFQEQRFRSRDVRCQVDPIFDECFMIKIDFTPKGKSHAQVIAKWEALFCVKEHVHITVTKIVKKMVNQQLPKKLYLI